MSVAFTIIVGSRPVAGRDVLRAATRTTPASGSSDSTATANSVSAQTAVIAQRAQDTLLRTAQAMKSMQAMQSAARTTAAAAASTVPNGLTSGGLVPAANAASSSTVWSGASQPTQTSANGKTLVSITQTQQQALLNWQSFNIGINTTLSFNQSAGGTDVGKWIAFNLVNDPTGVPSKILGSIQAAGQVYIINQNGIIFGGSSQVNAHALVASSLPINTNLLSAGLLSNSDRQFLFSSKDIPKLTGGSMDAFTAPAAPNTATGEPGAVEVQAGAVIECPTNSDHSGGRVMLVGPSVTNAGTITTPDGQTILAAGKQVGIDESADTTKRGLGVYIGDGAGAATNTGLIEAARGNITIEGKTVDQSGYLYSTTSVAYNGRIDLLANYGTTRVINSVTGVVSIYPTASGLVNLGAGSVTEIVPETWSTDTLVATALKLNSTINIKGLGINFGANSVLHAPSADVTISAGSWYNLSSAYYFGNTGGQVYFDSGAVVDVAGTENVELPVTQNILSVELRGTELADSTVQRNSLLTGKTVTVDARYGTPLADVDGWISLIGRTVAQLTTAGGNVSISAGNSVVLQTGARIDVSGGWINYTGGKVHTTRLISGGHIYDISQASADLVYDGIYSGFTETHSKWNVSKKYTSSLLSGIHYEAGYTEGANSGALTLTSPGMALDGDLYGNSVTGTRQRTRRPTSGSLALNFSQSAVSSGVVSSILPAPVEVVFETGTAQHSADAFTWNGATGSLRSDRVAKVILSPDLINKDGFGRVSIDNSNDAYGVTHGNQQSSITVAENVTLATPAGGSIKLTSANLDIEGSLIAAGGEISLTALNVSASEKSLATSDPDYDATRGNLEVGANATLSTAGLIVDDRSTSATHDTEPLVANGGSITIIANNANLKKGSALDVSGGLLTAATGKRTYGTGGKLTIQTGKDPNFGGTLGGGLVLGSNILGYGGLQTLSYPSTLSNGQSLLGGKLSFAVGGTGGTLTIQAPEIQVGGSDPVDGTFYVSSDFFNEGGFTAFSLIGIGSATEPGLVIEPGTKIKPVAKTRLFLATDSAQSDIVELSDGSRQPVNLSFAALGSSDSQGGAFNFRGNLVIGKDVVIDADALAKVDISGQTVAILGSVSAPGGTITVTGASSYPSSDSNPDNALPTVYLGPDCLLSTAGKVLLIPDSRGYRSGVVLNGGSITIDGNIVAAAGSILNVSGASGVLDLPVAYSGGEANAEIPTRLIVTPTENESNGGSITLKGEQELFSAATLTGSAGGSNATGGSVTISSGRFYADKSKNTSDINLTVSQSNTALAASYLALGSSLLGKAVVDSNGAVIAEHGYFAVDSLANGGFGSVTLGGNVEFKGDVTLGGWSVPLARLTVAKGGVLSATGKVTLTASYVALGQAFATPMQADEAANIFPFTKSNVITGDEEAYIAPSYGTGTLSVNATYIDIGNLSLQNIGNAYLYADSGSIRGDGWLDIAGHLTLRSGLIYTPSAVSFTIAAYDYTEHNVLHEGSVTLESSGVLQQTPLSAGGTLSVYGSIINQSGVLRAPFGKIILGSIDASTAPKGGLSDLSMPTTKQLTLGAGSVTSVSSYDPVTKKFLTIPYGMNSGTQWFDPKGVDITTSGLPVKKIEIAGASVTMDSGAQVDLRGGGDLMAYASVSGTGGTVDILSSTSKSFAVIPAYKSSLAPYGTYASGTSATANLHDSSGNIDSGYVSTSLKVGATVYLQGCAGLAAGYYTLLPARYALLSGAVLITPLNGAPTGTVTKTDGSHLVSGYLSNSLSGNSAQQVYQRFEVATSSVVHTRYEYDLYSANTFLKAAASSSNKTVQRLPMDSGHLILQATQSMTLDGSVLSQSVNRGRGGMIDISSPVDIVISGVNTTPQNGVLTLNATELSAMGAESLLIGGVRDDLGTTVDVNTDNLIVNNSGSPLTGPDIVLVANKTLTVAPDAVIEQKGEVSNPVGTLEVYRTTELATAGQTLLVPQDNTPITFTLGTPGNDTIISTRPGTITNADGTTSDFDANTAITVAKGASLTLSGDGSVTSSVTGTIKSSDGTISALGAQSLVSIDADATLTLSTAGTLTSTRAGTVTYANGTTVTLVPNVSQTIPAGATISFNNSGTITFVSGGTGGAIPIAVSDGVLLRVSGDVAAGVSRPNMTTLGAPKLTVGAGAKLSGNSLILDSTYATSLSPEAVLRGKAISLSSGQISLDFGSGTPLQSTSGLVLSGDALNQLFASANTLALRSYSSLDVYGSGTIGNSGFEKLTLHASDIRGFDSANATFMADTILLDNSTRGQKPAKVSSMGNTLAGSLTLEAGTLLLGKNTVNVEYYQDVSLKGSRKIVASGTGKLIASGALTLSTPYIAGETGSNLAIVAAGDLKIEPTSGERDLASAASLGATLKLQGASVEINSDIFLPSGVLKVEAKSGDVKIGTSSPTLIYAGGLERDFVDLIKYTSGGDVRLISDNGSVQIGSGGSIDLNGVGGTDAGSLTVSSVNGRFDLAGTLSASGGDGGSFTLDTHSLANTSAIDEVLNNASFFLSRSYRVRTGDVSIDGSIALGTYAKASSYSVSADTGSIDVAGVIDASGENGGTILLQANGSLTLRSGALLNVIGDDFSSSGAGGSVTLEAGCATLNAQGAVVANDSALLDIQEGSKIELGVLSNTAVAANAALGKLNGTLHLRAPIMANGLDVQVNAIKGAVKDASSIVVEGYKIFTTGSSGNIDNSVRTQVNNAGTTLLGASGVATASYTTMLNRLRGSNADLFGTNTGLDSVFSIQFGAEIVNPKGNLVLGGSATGATASGGDWDLSSYRFGPLGTPGVLTLKASGNLVFYNALSDGFASSSNTALLLAQNTALSVNAQSWSYRLTAGADFSAADFHQVLSLDSLSSGAGSLLLGKDGGQAKASAVGTSAQSTTNSVLNPTGKPSLYQVIRTGSGDIDISLGRNLELLNQFATIYTAGTQVVDATHLYTDGDFVLPTVTPPGVAPNNGNLGVAQQAYLAQYSMSGGDVTITAQWDMLHETLVSGVLKADSERQLPLNWLYRRSYVNATGEAGSITAGFAANEFTDPAASTTWWVDFSNFFEGIGALGGGNVKLNAGHNISNIDAVIPTNARMPKGTADSRKLVELGGGDLTVQAGHDIDAGVDYVEKGHGKLKAGNTIRTNSTRSPSLTTLASLSSPVYQNSLTWLPTTLFVGHSGFDVSALGDVLLGPVVNLFWLPQGVQNKFWYRTYFNTYSSDSYVKVSSLAGDVTLRDAVSTSSSAAAVPTLQAWLQNELLLGNKSAAYYQPWLRLDETSITQFSTVLTVMPPILEVTSFSADINIAGNLTLYPASEGTVDLLAYGSINGLQKVGVYTDGSVNTVSVWHSAVLNLSDAELGALPDSDSPLTSNTVGNVSDASVLKLVTKTFSESVSLLGTDSSLSTKQARHSSSLLHLDDLSPVHIYAAKGDISGFTLFSAKKTSVSAAQDITDIGFYIQNLRSTDVTMLSAGRDILLYDPKSPLHSQATSDGNMLDTNGSLPSGDVQIGGSGAVEILAGRDVDLGTGSSTGAASDTNLGIVTIGNARNPYLSSVGADILVAAGLGSSLGSDALDYTSFIAKFMDPTQSSTFALTYLPEIVPHLEIYLPNSDLTDASVADIWSAFETLSPEQQRTLALDVFFLVLRDSGRKHSDSSISGYNYQSGYAAIGALFPGNDWNGDILLTSREIKTKAGVSTQVAANATVSGTASATVYTGGNITLLTPGGGVDVGLKLQATQDQGILTEHGGNISIFSEGSISVGLSRIFTLRGGDLMIWSTKGDIAAGSSSKTIKSAPPTRVINDPLSANTQTDFGGLYTGGGIGVLASVSDVPVGNVDLIAPSGNIDAGDAGIRSTGNLHVAALQVLNASNIQVSGVSTGTPVAAAAPNISGVTSASNAGAAVSNAAMNATNPNNNHQSVQPVEEMPSIVTVEVIGYGGGDSDDEDDDSDDEDDDSHDKKAD